VNNGLELPEKPFWCFPWTRIRGFRTPLQRSRHLFLMTVRRHPRVDAHRFYRPTVFTRWPDVYRVHLHTKSRRSTPTLRIVVTSCHFSNHRSATAVLSVKLRILRFFTPPSTSASHRLDQRARSFSDKRELANLRYRNRGLELASARLRPVDPGSG
jgi:hypothetical protein